jgi:hypothetical protein
MPRVTYANVAATVCLVAVGGAAATGAFGRAAAPAKITACAAKTGSTKGLLRLASKCKRSERKVTWNVKGVQGPQGFQGAAGQNGVDATAPTGAVMYFDLGSCPAGWSNYEPGRGRYLVGVPSGGTQGATVGTALSDTENRPTGQHTHAVNDPGHFHTVDFDTERLANMGNTIGGTSIFGTNSASENSHPALTHITIANAGTVAGTNAPYLQLLLCRKG